MLLSDIVLCHWRGSPKMLLSFSVADLPSYSRPSFPSPSGSSNYGYGYAPVPKERQRISNNPKTPTQPNGIVDNNQGLRTNPLTLAFDTKDVSVLHWLDRQMYSIDKKTN